MIILGKCFSSFQVNGNAPKTDVFDRIDRLLTGLLEQRKAAIESLAAAAWLGPF